MARARMIVLVAALLATGARATPEPAAGARIERLDPALDRVIAPGTQIERVATGFKFAEGPMWRQGRLWFSDLVGNRLYAVAPDGKVELLIDHAGGLLNPPAGSFKGSNGLVTTRDGAVLMNQHGQRRIVRLDAKMGQKVFLDRYRGRQLNSPNDLVYAPDGSLWFTDPPYGLTGQDKDPAKGVRADAVYRYAGGRLEQKIVDLPRPNGIGFADGGRTLYVSNSEPRMRIMRYTVAPGGRITAGRVFIAFAGPNPTDVPDGLKIDSAGDVWASGPGGIRIISPAGKVLGQIKLPEVAANLAWAEDGRTAYITGSTSIYRLRLRTPGALPLYRR